MMQMKILRNGKEIELTRDELFVAWSEMEKEFRLDDFAKMRHAGKGSTERKRQ